MIPTTVKKVPRWPAIQLLIAGFVCAIPTESVAQRPAPSAERAYASAVQLYEQQLYADARTAFESFVRSYPEHSQTGQAVYLGARSALAQNRDQDASRLFGTLEDTYPGHPRAPEAQLSLAQYFLEEGQSAEARTQLTAIVEDPSSPAQAARALYLLGKSEQERGNLNEALTNFQRITTEYAQADVAPAASYAVAATQIRLEQYDEAAVSFEELGRRYPDSPFAENLGTALGEVYYRRNAFEQAASELQDRLSQLEGDQRARAQFLLAESYNQLRRGEEAVGRYRRVIDEHPRSPYVGPAQYGLAHHYLRSNQYAKAADRFALVRREQSGSYAERSAYYEAISHAREGQIDQAIELYQMVVDQRPDSRLASEALYEAGLLRYQQEKYGSAAASFRTLVRDYSNAPRVGDAYYWLANAYLADKSLDRALDAYNQAIKRDAAPDSLLVEARFQKAWAQYEDERYDQAADGFLSIANNFPDTPRGREALFWGGDSHYQRGNFDRARTLFRRYIDGNPDGSHLAGARYALAWTHFKQNRYEEAARRFRQFLAGDSDIDSDVPYKQDARLRLADSYLALKRYEDAVNVYRQASGDGADYALFRAGEALNYADRQEDALRSLNRLLEQYPNSRWRPEAVYQIASIKFQQQNYEEARASYRRFLSDNPDHPLAPEARYGIGDSYYNAGNMTEAVGAYREVLETYPESASAEEAALSLFFALDAAGDADRAEDLIGEINGATPNTNLEDRLRFARAKAAYQSGQSTKALKLFQNFVRTSSATDLLPESYYYLGLLYADQDDVQPAKNYLQQLVEQYPDSDVQPEGALRLGDLYTDDDAYQEAADAYATAAESDAINEELRAQARYGQSTALLNLGRNEDASTLLNRILDEEQSGPLQASARLGLARIHEDEGRTGEALSLYRSVAETSDSEAGAEALYRLGRLLRTQNRSEEAIRELDRMSSLFAGYPEWVARSLLEQARAYRQMGETGQAAQLYDEVAETYPGTPFAETAEEERDAL
jgi:TolA-binding protein